MRPELIHPMLVHFPIALLFTGSFIRIAALFTKKKKTYSFLLPASWMILGLGVIAAWAAIIAGEIARDIVAQTLENIQVLNKHDDHAYYTAYAFTLAVLCDVSRAFLVKQFKKKNLWIKRGIACAIWIFYLFGAYNLVLTGYYGGTLVYEEGAAVNASKK
ncbi:MAG: hypothetical protein K2P51_05455 [Rhabdochlamydiaceae bacterium]|nr:hypothetical protein [Rhabdochlamydiaceae bacterium]